MAGGVAVIWLYVILAGVLILIAATARAVILAATRPGPGRCELREQAAEREADDFIATLRPLPRPGKDIYTDHTVRLPWTPPADLAPFMPPPAWTPTTAELDELTERFDAAHGQSVYPRFEQEALISDEAARRGERQLPHRTVDLEPMDPGDIVEAERLASDTDVRAVTCAAPARPAGMHDEPDVADVLPDWVIEALNGHNGVDAAVESIVARAVSNG